MSLTYRVRFKCRANSDLSSHPVNINIDCNRNQNSPRFLRFCIERPSSEKKKKQQVKPHGPPVANSPTDARKKKKKKSHKLVLVHRKPAVSTHPQLSVFGTEGKWRIFRKSRNIFGRTPFSIIIVWKKKTDKTKANYKAHNWSDPHDLSLVNCLFSLSTSVLQFVCLLWVTQNLYSVKKKIGWYWYFVYMKKFFSSSSQANSSKQYLQVELQAVPPLLQDFGNPVSDVFRWDLRWFYALL